MIRLADGLDLECKVKKGAKGTSGVLVLNQYMVVILNENDGNLDREKLQSGGVRNQYFFYDQIRAELLRNFQVKCI